MVLKSSLLCRPLLLQFPIYYDALTGQPLCSHFPGSFYSSKEFFVMKRDESKIHSLQHLESEIYAPNCISTSSMSIVGLTS